MSTFPKLPSPVVPIETFVVPATLDAKRGEEAVQRCIREGLLKPTDIASAELDGPTLLFVPFWRIALSVDGFHVGLSSIQVGKEGRTIPLPTGGSNHREGVLMIGARTIFPYEPKLPSFFGRIGGVPPLEVGMNELVALDAAKDALAAGERVDAEVDEARARSIASDMLVRAVTPSQAIYSNYGAKVTACTFCLYPVYYARYRYEGEARRHAGEDFFVAVSGKTGAPISAKHPSAVRAMATRLRKILSFDRR